MSPENRSVSVAWYAYIRRRLPDDWALRWPPRVVSGVLLALIALVIALGVREVRRPQGIGVRVTIPVVGTVATRPAAAASVSALVKEHLFGVPAQTVPVPVAVLQNLKVVGIVTGATPAESSVDLVMNGTEHLWRAGDTLPDGSVITAIQNDSVTLQRGNGTRSTLPFDLRPAPLNGVFKTLPIVRSQSGDEAIVAAQGPARTKPPSQLPVAKELTVLRAIALRKFAAHTHHMHPR